MGKKNGELKVRNTVAAVNTRANRAEDHHAHVPPQGKREAAAFARGRIAHDHAGLLEIADSGFAGTTYAARAVGPGVKCGSLLSVLKTGTSKRAWYAMPGTLAFASSRQRIWLSESSSLVAWQS